MTARLPQKYQAIARALMPYVPDSSEQIALIAIDPALPCFICNQPATRALIAPARDHLPGSVMAWLTLPICHECEQRQIKSQPGVE